MKLLRSTLLLCLLASGLAGCTYTESAPEPAREPSQPSATPMGSPAAVPLTLQGQFQSQGATTTGTATIRVTESGAALQLEDFATGPGDSIRLMLSPGTLRPGPTREPELSSSTLIELGPLRLDRAGSQRIDLEPGRWESMPEPVRSVVIYNYADRVAYGTANLVEAPPS